MFEHVCIIILNWNGKEDTLECLRSLREIGCEKIIVDNGSTDGSCEAIQNEFGEVTILKTGVNLGYAGGNNVGIEYGLKKGFEFLFILNNDTVVDPGILEAFLAQFAQMPETGILGAKILRMDEPERLDHLGGVWNGKRAEFDYVGYREEEKKFEVSSELDYVCGAALMVRREVFEMVGLFDPRFFLFWEEADLCMRARAAGFSVATCPKAKVWHKISASFTGGKPHAAYFVRRNRLLFIEKNFSGAKRLFLLTKIVASTLPYALFSRSIRNVQKRAQKLLGRDFQRNQERIVRESAVITATMDYLLRRFEAGRSKKFMNCQ